MSKHGHILHGKGELVAEFNFSVGQLLLRQLTTHDTRIAQVKLYVLFKYIYIYM